MREVMRHSEWMSGYQCEIEDNPARRSVEIHSDGSLTAESRLKHLSVDCIEVGVIVNSFSA